MKHPITQAIDRLIREQEQRHDWLLRAGPVAKQMNLESRGDSND